MAVREVAFELECFEWADERLEVAGRWQGLAGRRLVRPVLSVDTQSGRRKRLVAMPGGHFGAAEESWRASFAWPGDPAEITGAELEVGGNVVVDLPLPDRRRRRRKRPPVDAGDEALRLEVGGLRAQVERLRAELAGRERENMQLRAQLDEDGEDEPAAVAEAGDATVEIERLAGEREELTAELARLAEEGDRTRSELVAEVERLQDERAQRQADIDDLREAFAEAAAEAEASRDRHRAELEGLQDELRAERATVARLTAELAGRPELPPPATESARRAAAAAPPTEPLAAPVAPERSLPAVIEAASVPGVLDPPGPQQAGGRPSRIPAWLRAGRRPEADPADAGEAGAANGARAGAAPAEGGGPGAAPLHAVKERLEKLFAPNGHAVAEEETGDDYEPVPGPLRTASAARARAEATAAARRSPAELWGLRILAVLLVSVLLVAFLLILTSIT